MDAVTQLLMNGMCAISVSSPEACYAGLKAATEKGTERHCCDRKDAKILCASSIETQLWEKERFSAERSLMCQRTLVYCGSAPENWSAERPGQTTLGAAPTSLLSSPQSFSHAFVTRSFSTHPATSKILIRRRQRSLSFFHYLVPQYGHAFVSSLPCNVSIVRLVNTARIVNTLTAKHRFLCKRLVAKSR